MKFSNYMAVPNGLFCTRLMHGLQPTECEHQHDIQSEWNSSCCGVLAVSSTSLTEHKTVFSTSHLSFSLLNVFLSSTPLPFLFTLPSHPQGFSHLPSLSLIHSIFSPTPSCLSSLHLAHPLFSATVHPFLSLSFPSPVNTASLLCLLFPGGGF